MTYLWPAGEPIQVVSDAAHTPQTIVWAGQRHRVQQIAKRWRLDADWWRERVFREYFKLSTQSGLLLVIYLDWLSGQWYLQRLYD